MSAASAGGAPHAGSVDTLADGAAGESQETVVRSEQRSAHRSKRPPPLPNRKAHKIKRIKSQRSTPWAALEPERLRESHAGDELPADDAEARAVGATTLVRREADLIDAEREQAEQRRGHTRDEKPHGLQRAQVRAPAPSEPDRRWLLLLRVGRDELAGIWDGRLASCEPSVWRPATKTWAPLFEVPQIATLVTATVKQRQAKVRGSVPASPAPRRRQSSGVSVHPAAAGTRRSSVPPGPGQTQLVAGQVRAALASLPEGEPQSPPPRNETLRPSSMAELGGQIHPLAPAARLALRSPYIPPPPRVPNLATAAQVQPAYADESSSGPLPSYAAEQLYRQPVQSPEAPPYGQAPYAASGAFEAAQAAHAFEAAQTSASEARVIPLTRRTGRDQTPYSHTPPGERSFTPADAVLDSFGAAPPADSYAPHAHALTPLQPPRSAGIGERAGWLFGGVAAAFLLTTFTGVGSSMREGVASWFDPKPRAVLSDEAASQAASAAQPTASETGSTADTSDDAAEKDAPNTVSVDELPMLSKSGEVLPAREKAEARADHAREKAKDDEPATARSQSRAPTRAFAASHAQAAPAPAKPQPVRFDAASARRALQSSVARAQFCAAERANGTIVVTFAPAGGVASVSLANLTGDDVRKGCVLNAFRGARITPFQGDPVTVQKSFQLR